MRLRHGALVGCRCAAVGTVRSTYHSSAVHVPRDEALIPPARPLRDSDERSLTSAAFEGIAARSTQPPRQVADEPDPAVRAELESRLIIIIGMGVHSGPAQYRSSILDSGPRALPLFEYSLCTFFPVAQPNFVYRCVCACSACLWAWA